MSRISSDPCALPISFVLETKKRTRCITRVDLTNGAKLILNSSGRSGTGTPSTLVVRAISSPNP
jgi:hypothetical protein